jgi:hypothetical protein
MRRFLVEAHTPAGTAIGVIEDRARQAAAELSEPETPARYLRPVVAVHQAAESEDWQ